MSNDNLILTHDNTRIVVDSSSNVPAAIRAQYGMIEVPTLINFGTESFRNNVDLSEVEFYRKLAASDQIPTTSQPPPKFFADAYQACLAEGADHIVVVTITKNLSGTFGSAQTATREFDTVGFTMWDGDSISLGSGWQAIIAARLLEEGLTAAALVAQLDKIRAATHGFATLDTLKYAALSGRIGNLQANLGNLLQVKAILEIAHGQVVNMARARGRKRALRDLIERIDQQFGSVPLNLGIIHADALADAEALAEDVRTRLQVAELLFSDIGPAIASFGGPGALGIVGFPAALATSA